MSTGKGDDVYEQPVVLQLGESRPLPSGTFSEAIHQEVTRGLKAEADAVYRWAYAMNSGKPRPMRMPRWWKRWLRKR